MESVRQDRSPLKGAVRAVAFILVLACALAGMAFGIQHFSDPEFALLLRTEEGYIERATVLVYGVALVICLFLVIRDRWRFGLLPSIVILAAISRELDLQIRKTATGTVKMTSIRYWRSPEFPFFEKLVGGFLVIGFFVALYFFLRRYLPRFLADLRGGCAYAFTILGALAFTLGSDRVDRLLEGRAIDNPRLLFLCLLEESLELGIALLCCIALIQFGSLTRKNPLPPVHEGESKGDIMG